MSERIKTFETIMIFHERLTEEMYEEKIREYKNKLRDLPATRIKTDKLCKRNLAYATRGCTQGWYAVFTYETTESNVTRDLDLMLRKDDDVIKFLSVAHSEGEYEDYTPDEDIAPRSEQKRKPVDVFDLIFGLEEVI